MFHEFELRPGSSDTLAVYAVYNATNTTSFILSYSASSPPPLNTPVQMPADVGDVLFVFTTEADGGLLYPLTAHGWNLTYVLRPPQPDPVSQLINLTDIHPRFHLVADVLNIEQRAILVPLTQTPAHTTYDFELVSFPDRGSGAEAYVEIYENGAFVNNCTGVSSLVNHCRGTFVGQISLVFRTFITEPGSVAMLVGRADVASTCDGSQIIRGFSGTIEDGSGPYTYNDNQNCYWLLEPDEPESEHLAVAFVITELDTEQSDKLTLFQGNTTNELAYIYDYYEKYALRKQTPVFSGGACLPFSCSPPLPSPCFRCLFARRETECWCVGVQTQECCCISRPMAHS